MINLHNIRSTRRLHHDETGIALITGIIIAMVVLGILAAITVVVGNRSFQANNATQATKSLFWMNAASDDLSNRLERFDIGYLTAAASPAVSANWRLITVPTAGQVSTPQGAAFRLSILSPTSGKTELGYYQVMSPITGAPANTAAYKTGTDEGGDKQGEVVMIVRGWDGASS